MAADLSRIIFSLAERVVEIQERLISCKALAPSNGGLGELEKARYIETQLEQLGIEFTRFDSPDPMAEEGVRPNIVARIGGKKRRYLWLFAHMDVVPAGDVKAWTGSPWEIRREGDFLFGRGVEDNQQAIVSMLVLAEAIKKSGIEPETGLGLVFLADEECGSGHGMKWLLERTPRFFNREDFFIVPDGGSEDAAEIEIAEKGQLWLKITVKGKQSHASMPHLGNNAFLGASQLVLALQSLYRFFPQRNELFNPPFSTFVPTRHEENVAAINIMPGKEVFYLDCRIIPELDFGLIIKKATEIADEVARILKLGIEIETVQEQKPTSVSPNSPVTRALEKAILKIYGVNARPVGIGGATVAAFLREKGFPAVVWSCLLGTCHQPNERSSITASLKDAAVFGEIITARDDGDRHAS